MVRPPATDGKATALGDAAGRAAVRAVGRGAMPGGDMGHGWGDDSETGDGGDDPATRPDDGVANWITPAGLAWLEEQLRTLEAERGRLGEGVDDRPRAAGLERDLRHLRRRLERACVVDPAGQPRDEVRFGAEVETRDEAGARHVVRLVGDDETDTNHGRVSWRSPLGRALTGARVGDRVVWQRPAGDRELEVTAIRYPDPGT